MTKKSWVGLGLAWGLLLQAAAGADEPKAPPLARYVSSSQVTAYFEYDGVAAHPAAWSRSMISWLLHDKQAGAPLREAIRSTLSLAFVALAGGEVPIAPSTLVAASEELLR